MLHMDSTEYQKSIAISETNITHENMPFGKEISILTSNHPFSGANG